MVSIAAACEDVVIRGNKFITIAGGTNSEAILCVGAAPRIQIYDNFFSGDWSAACITASAAASLDVLIRDNILDNLDPTTGKCIVVHAGTTGAIIRNIMHAGLDGTSPLTQTACLCAQNYYTNAEAASAALLTPATDA
jgi:hypothetical protein